MSQHLCLPCFWVCIVLLKAVCMTEQCGYNGILLVQDYVIKKGEVLLAKHVTDSHTNQRHDTLFTGHENKLHLNTFVFCLFGLKRDAQPQTNHVYCMEIRTCTSVLCEESVRFYHTMGGGGV